MLIDVGSVDAPRNAVWAYESPHPAMIEIPGHLTLYPDRVGLIEQS